MSIRRIEQSGWYNLRNMEMNTIAKLSAVVAIWTFHCIGAEVEYLWHEERMPDAQPHQIAAMTDVAERLDFVADWGKRFTGLGFQCVNLVYRTEFMNHKGYNR